MAKSKQSDTRVTMLGVVVAIAVVAGIAVAWFYFQYYGRPTSPVTYSSFGPVVVRGSQFSIRATVAVQTQNADASWVQTHRKELNFALQTALTNADPVRVKGPGGLAYLQGILRDAANTALNTHNVQEILLTDFVIQSN